MPNTKRYLAWRARAVRALRDVDAPGWTAAKITWEAVTYLMTVRHMTKGKALAQWSRDIHRPRWSATSARRYFEVWDRYGDPTKRLRFQGIDDAEILSFAEHYAIVRGGQPAYERIMKARAEGRGVHSQLHKTQETLG